MGDVAVVDRAGGVRELVLDRPAAMNAMGSRSRGGGAEAEHHVIDDVFQEVPVDAVA
jgi:enoyl-CoA hydratase/carnithine racemase